eukprot:1679416-Ditylum_brightwellii.AAC.1
MEAQTASRFMAILCFSCLHGTLSRCCSSSSSWLTCLSWHYDPPPATAPEPPSTPFPPHPPLDENGDDLSDVTRECGR